MHRAFRLALLLLPLAGPAFGDDWPQILGPSRNGVAEMESLAPWPENGPKMVWSAKIGFGYAGPVVADGKTIVFHRQGDREVLEAFDSTSGEKLWSTDFAATYRGGINPDTGPRATPLVHEGRVYAYGAAGALHCVDLMTGKAIWSRATYKDFGGEEGYFGAGASPMAMAGNVLVNVGGKGAGIVAFDLATGETKWKATDERASYSSPAAAVVAGDPLAIFVTRLKCVGIEPQSGKVRFEFPFGSRGPTVNAATPLLIGDNLFLSASYGVGARLVDLGGKSPTTIWDKDGVMSSQYTTCVPKDGFLYGADGREDVGVAKLKCVEAKTGRVVWTEEDFGVANLILAGDKLLILRVDGQLLLAEATPKEYRELASAKVFGNTSRALPALANGRLYARDTSDEGGTLKCFNVGANE